MIDFEYKWAIAFSACIYVYEYIRADHKFADQPMRDVVILQRRLSLAGRRPWISPVYHVALYDHDICPHYLLSKPIPAPQCAADTFNHRIE